MLNRFQIIGILLLFAVILQYIPVPIPVPFLDLTRIAQLLIFVLGIYLLMQNDD